MAKVKILSISKNEKRSLYAFKKEQNLFNIIREILIKLDFEKNPWLLGLGRPWDEESEEPILNKEDDINSEDYNERIQNFQNKNYSVDIIFFINKVVIIFNYNKDMQQEISKVIGEFIKTE
ncbi:MAG: hypothetical protein WDZ69_01995 [Candidatus Pacearchaeota archaeon]